VSATLAEIAGAAYDAGRAVGYRHALVDIAARVVEVDDAWRPAARVEHERRVADRVALFVRCAEQFAEKLGRPYVEYRGGEVDWHTGKPVRRLEVAA
jgi:hypothetical protein